MAAAGANPVILVSGGTYTQNSSTINTGKYCGIRLNGGVAILDGGTVSSKGVNIQLSKSGSTVKITDPSVIDQNIGSGSYNIQNCAGSTVIIGDESSDAANASYSIPAVNAGGGTWNFPDSAVVKAVTGKFSADSEIKCFFETDIVKNLPGGFGCQAVSQDGKTYYQVISLTAENAAAKIGGTYYASTKVAAEALQKGDTLTLLKDYSSDSPLTIKMPDVTIDLNGCSITNTSTEEGDYGLSLEPTYGNIKQDSTIRVVGKGTITAPLPLNMKSGNSKYTICVTLADTVSLQATGSDGTIRMGTASYMLSSPAVLNGINGGFGAVVNGESRVYGTFAAAAEDSGTNSATLLKSYTGTESIAQSSSGNWSLDLAGNTYTVAGTDTAIKVNDGANLQIKNGTVQLKDAKSADNTAAGAYVTAGSTLTLEKVDLVSDGTYGILTHGNDEKVSITLSGGSVTAPAEGAGIYFPSANSTLTIDGTAITAGTGLAIKGGTVTVKKGSSIRAIGAVLDPDSPSGSGFTGEGDAIYLEGNYDRDAVITLEGGTFSSQNGKAVQVLFVTGSGNKSVQIRGGYYDGSLNGEAGKLVVSGGAFTNDPSAYVADGKIAVSQKEVKDNVTYYYAVAENSTGLDVDIQTGKSSVKVEGDLTTDEREAAQEAAETVQATEGLNAAGGNIALNPGVSGEEVVAALTNGGVTVTNTATLVVQPYLEILVKDYENSAERQILLMDVTPKYNLLATLNPANMVTEDTGKNTVPIKTAQPLEIQDGETVTIQLTLPSGFATQNLYAKHTKQDGRIYHYPVTVQNNTASFNVLHGFSFIELRQDNRTGSLEFRHPDGSETKTYVPSDIGSLLPRSSKAGYNFQGWSIDGVVYTELTDELLTKISLNGAAMAADPVFSKAASSDGSSFTQRQTAFWDEVKETLKKAEPGDTVKVNARSYDQMPYSVMKLLGELDNVTLHISWNGGEDIVIPSAFAVNEVQRVYYPLSYLEGMDFGTAQGSGTPDKVNPATGGILWVEAPVSDDLGDVPVTDAKLGLSTDAGQTDASIQAPAVDYEAESAEKAESTGSAAVLGIAAGVVLLAAGAGYWYWKRKEQE